VLTCPLEAVYDSTTVAGDEAGVEMVVVPDGVLTVKVDGDGMYSVATDPDGVTIWTVLTSAATEVVVVPPDEVNKLEMTVGTEVGTTSVEPDGVMMLTVDGDGTGLTDSMTGEVYETSTVPPAGVV
jgi:hypothetical protein